MSYGNARSLRETQPLRTDYDEDESLEEQRRNANAEQVTAPPGLRCAPTTQQGKLVRIGIIVLLIIGVVIAVVVVTTGNGGDDPSRATPTETSSPAVPSAAPGSPATTFLPTRDDDQIPAPNPSPVGTSGPTTSSNNQELYQNVTEALVARGISSREDLLPLDGSETFQKLALNFLLDDDPLNLLGSGVNTPASRVEQRYISAVLYYATVGASWINSDGWLTGVHECQWHGMTCVEISIPSEPLLVDSTSNNTNTGLDTVDESMVVEIRLEANNLVRTLPDEIGFFANCNTLGLWQNALVGPIPSTIGNLPLTKLWLDQNRFVGTIPSTIGKLSSLKDITLYDNFLSGNLPTELGELTNVERLWADELNLTGPIPSEIGNMEALINLYLDGNELTGSIPSEVGKLSNLKDLRLFGNLLSGSIPSELFALPNLKVAYIDTNSINGTLPTTFSQLSSIEDFQAFSNNLSGTIPIELAQTEYLTVLKLHDNNLTGTIPDVMGSSGKLLSLSLSGNELTGSIPDSITNCTLLRRLELGNNSLDGNLPTWVGTLNSLLTLNVQSNNLDGPIPTELGLLTNIVEILLEDNSLTGVVPEALCNLTSIDVLSADCQGSSPEVQCSCCTLCQ